MRTPTDPAPKTAKRPHCHLHPDGDTDDDCRICMRRRKWDTTHAGDIAAAERQATHDRAAAAAAIRDACTICDKDGFAPDDEGAPTIRCTHPGAPDDR